MLIHLIRNSKRLATMIAAGAATVAAASPASAYGSRTFGAINGTTANKSYTSWQEFNVGGVKNNSSSARDWLMPVSMDSLACDGPTPCTVKATLRGGTGGSSCVSAYRLDEFGAVIGQLGPVCQDSTLTTKTLGTIAFPNGALTGSVLFVANLAGGGGALTTVEVTDLVTGSIAGIGDSRGAVRGNTAAFDLSNWGEFRVGGVQNKATNSREWLVSVPMAKNGAASATFGGGSGQSSCVIAYGVTALGAVASASAQVCKSTVGLADFGTLTGAHVLYVASLGRASTTGATDGGALTTILY